MRHVLAAGWLGLAAILAVSCSTDSGGIKPLPVGATATSTASDRAQDQAIASPKSSAPPVTTSLEPPPPVLVTPDKADSILISADDVGRLVGSPLTYEFKSTSPSDSAASGKCQALAGLRSESLGEEWTTYRGSRLQETEKRYDHIVWQAVVLFPDAKAAASQLQAAYPPSLTSCQDSRQTEGDTEWRIGEFSNNGTSVKWVRQELQDGKPAGWRCFYDYRVKNNALFGGLLCQNGNGAPIVTAIVDRMAEWIPA
ncbi:sensor domain-containing protein [Mycobacterium sp. NPDC050853]|uniref:sensor domain-containing protein n=1 Tax=Mycobacterium sp. NPDC050853 TaxID=3155160 RepID=UPI00340784EC